MFETSRERSEKTANTPALAVPDSASRPGGEQDRLSDAPTAGRFAEFFAGIGLIREAIEPLGWQCVFANDIAPRKEEMYRRRFGDEHFHLGDIHDLGIGDLPRGLDLVTASFPCIDLSLAGNRAGLAGQHSGTIWPFLDIVTALCIQRTPPSAVLLENVTGFLTSRGERISPMSAVVWPLSTTSSTCCLSTPVGSGPRAALDCSWRPGNGSWKVRGAGRIHGLRACVPPPYAGSRQLIPSCPSSTCLCRHRRLRHPTLSFLSLRIFRRTMPAGGPRTVLPPWSPRWRR